MLVILVDTMIYLITMLYEQDGNTALMIATRKGHDKCVSILVANGADLNMATKVLE